MVAHALLIQRQVCERIVAGGGEYLLPVKENQPTPIPSGYRDLEVAFSPARNLGGWWAKRTPLAGGGVASTRGQADGLG